MQKRFLIAGNWKMYKTIAETRGFFARLQGLLQPTIHSELLIFPPFTALAVAHEIKPEAVILGAQNVYPKPSGAFTGEISPEMLQELVTYVLVGHSERRTLLQESNTFICEKIYALLEAHLKPILCVGETLLERQQNRAFSVIETELQEGLARVSQEQIADVTIAYEPIWAIGSGETATPETAEAMHGFIRQWLQEHFGRSAASVRLLYGGSLKGENAHDLLSQPNIDGGLIGGASLTPESFLEIARIADALSPSDS